jgi:hypothetical protein
VAIPVRRHAELEIKKNFLSLLPQSHQGTKNTFMPCRLSGNFFIAVKSKLLLCKPLKPPYVPSE